MLGALRKVAFVIACATAVAARAADPLVLYFNEDNERVSVALGKLRAAIDATGGARHRVTVEHVAVDYANLDGIRQSLRKAAARRPAVIVAASALIAQLAQEEGVTTPLVFASGQDPLRMGLARSIRRPGGAMTGLVIYRHVEGKRLELLAELAPAARRVGVLIDEWWDRSPEDRDPSANVLGVIAKRDFGFELLYFRADSLAALDAVAQDPRARGVDAWYIPATRLAFDHPAAVARTVASFRKPAIHALSLLAENGGVISYQAAMESPFEAWAKMIVLILDGYPAGEIPLERPQRYQLSINAKAARDQGISIPKSILLRATNFY